MIIKFGRAKSINTYIKAKICLNTTQILDLKYIYIDFAAPNLQAKVYVFQISSVL